MRRWIFLRRFLVIGSMLALVFSHMAMYREYTFLLAYVRGVRRDLREVDRLRQENEKLRRENDAFRLRSEEVKMFVSNQRQIKLPLGWQITEDENGALVVEPIPDEEGGRKR